MKRKENGSRKEAEKCQGSLALELEGCLEPRTSLRTSPSLEANGVSEPAVVAGAVAFSSSFFEPKRDERRFDMVVLRFQCEEVVRRELMTRRTTEASDQ